MRADIFADRHRSARGGRRTRLGLAHVAELHGAERSKATGDKARSAQERTAVDAITRLIGKCGGETTAACLTFCFLDQHGGLLQLG